MKKKYILYTLVILILTSYFFVNQSIGNKTSILQKGKDYIPQTTKDFLIENIFIYKYKEKLKKEIKYLNTTTIGVLKRKLAIKEIQLENLLAFHGSIPVKKSDKIEKFQIKNNNYNLKKFKTNFLFVSKHDGAKGSSYLDYFDNKLFIASESGIFGYVDIEKFNNNKFDILIIPSNIKELIKYYKFYSSL